LLSRELEMVMQVPPNFNRFSETSRRVYSALRKHSSLAWPILKKQCELARLDPTRLYDTNLDEIVPALTGALSRFTSPQKGKLFSSELLGGPPRKRVRNIRDSLEERIYQPSVTLDQFARRVFAVLREATPLAWPIFERLCHKAELDPATLTPEQLELLLSDLEVRMVRFTSQKEATLVKQRLEALTPTN